MAVDQRNEARSQLQLATSRLLAGQAKAAVGQQRAQALLLSLEALRARDTPEARDALLTALLRTPHLRMLLQPPDADARSVAVSPNGKLIAAGTTRGTVHLWDWSTGRPRGELRGTGDVTDLQFTQDTSGLVALSAVRTVAGG